MAGKKSNSRFLIESYFFPIYYEKFVNSKVLENIFSKEINYNLLKSNKFWKMDKKRDSKEMFCYKKNY